jgi:L-alanine-DL-glutamate epimerase-like enolase superfamily enzyme
MKITEIKPILLSYEYDENEAWGWSGGTVDIWNTALVQISTDEGISGLGEMGTAHYMPEAGRAILEHLSHMLMGQDPFAIEVLAAKMYSLGANWGRRGLAMGVISGIENALWDIKGKALGVPVHSLLGGKYRSSIRIYASGGMEKPLDALAEEVKGYVAKGFTAVKVRGGYSPKKDSRIAETVRKAVGDDIDIMLDAGQGYVPQPWPVKTAEAVCRALADYKLYFIEEPARTDQVECYAKITAASPIPVAGGENGCSIFEFKHLIDADAVDIVQPDVTHAGGIWEVKRIADYAYLHGKSVIPHVFRSAVGMAAHLHLVAAIPNCPILEYQTIPNPLRKELFIEPPEFKDGMLSIPDTPGLGVFINDDIIKKYAFKPGKVQRFKVESN